ncbi:MAG TPA: hypothetical protein VLK55_06570, partial [Kocuria rosea]|nr:hypothetical protein [Kocuria rosea]
MDQLEDGIADPDHRHVSFQPELVVRASTRASRPGGSPGSSNPAWALDEEPAGNPGEHGGRGRRSAGHG